MITCMWCGRPYRDGYGSFCSRKCSVESERQDEIDERQNKIDEQERRQREEEIKRRQRQREEEKIDRLKKELEEFAIQMRQKYSEISDLEWQIQWPIIVEGAAESTGFGSYNSDSERFKEQIENSIRFNDNKRKKEKEERKFLKSLTPEQQQQFKENQRLAEELSQKETKVGCASAIFFFAGIAGIPIFPPAGIFCFLIWGILLRRATTLANRATKLKNSINNDP